jgi:hypothetical protein
LPEDLMKHPVGSTWIILIALCAACGDDDDDDSTSQDAGTDGAVEDGGGDGDAGPGGIIAHGTLALINQQILAGLGEDFEVCVVGHPEMPCVMTGLLGDYQIGIPENEEGALRIHRDGFVDWLKPFHSATSDVNTFAIAMPDPDLTDALLASVGGLQTDQAYVVVYVERPIPNDPLELHGRGVAGYTVEASAGEVHYVADDLLSLDDAATATTPAGLVVVTDLPASPWAEDAEPETETFTLVPPDAEEACTTPVEDNMWLHPDSLTVDAPLYQGHFTYAMFLTCPPL